MISHNVPNCCSMEKTEMSIYLNADDLDEDINIQLCNMKFCIFDCRRISVPVDVVAWMRRQEETDGRNASFL